MKIRVTLLMILLLTVFIGCASNSKEPAITAKPTAKPTPTQTASTEPTATPSAPAVTATPAEEQMPKPMSNITKKPLNNFTLDVTLKPDEHTLFIKQSIEYNNNTGTELTDVYFNIIPQAFEMKKGGIQINEVTVDGTSCAMQQVDRTVYKVDLPKPLADAGVVTIQLDYEVKVPHIADRFGYFKDHYNLGNFIATPAVYEQDGWTIEPYENVGDAFYTDIANYKVTIHAPKEYTIAASGEEIAEGTYQANKVRDFAFCAGKGYQVMKKEYKDTLLQVYYPKGNTKTAERVMKAAKKSLMLFNRTYCKYPYKTLSMVVNDMQGDFSGMEYPTLVMLSPTPIEKLKEKGVDLSDQKEVDSYLYAIDTLTCHEIAHQWFYGIVGNDELSNAWLDEGMATYSEYLYECAYPAEVIKKSDNSLAKVFPKNYETVVQESKNKESKKPDILNKTLNYWIHHDTFAYFQIYSRGGSLIYQMQKKMGKDEFLAAMKEYVKKFKYNFVTTESFKEFWMSKCDFKELFTLYQI